jgi:hypothetical protein
MRVDDAGKGLARLLPPAGLEQEILVLRENDPPELGRQAAVKSIILTCRIE